MNSFTTKEYVQMTEALQSLAMQSGDVLKNAEKSFHIVEASLQRLKEYILTYSFKSQQEEITFFKETKPAFLKELIYFRELYHIEASKPLADINGQVAYYKHVIERINTFFERHHVIYIYYRMERDNFDMLFFLRGANISTLEIEYSLDLDPNFSTVHSARFAEIQAYEILNDYLLQSIYSLEHPDIHTTDEKKKERNFWTDPKSALIELAYALYVRGSVNHGKGGVRRVITALERAFNIQLGNAYRTFQSMRARKKSRTPFLDSLPVYLERKMDDDDLGYS